MTDYFMPSYSTTQVSDVMGFSNSKIQEHNETAYHYTSFSNCVSMLKLGEPECQAYELWATHYHFMNDTSEIIGGIQKAEKKAKNNIKDKRLRRLTLRILRKIKECKLLLPHFIVCFHEEPNNLAQWKYYGKNCGVSIEYDLPNLIYSGYFSNKFCDFFIPRKVVYGNAIDKEVEDDLKSIGKISPPEESQVSKIIYRILLKLTFSKNKHFEAEKEVRLMFSPTYSSDSLRSYKDIENECQRKIHYRSDDGFIKPYIKIRLKHKTEGFSPIKSITVGPGHNQEYIYQSLIMSIQSKFQTSKPSVYFNSPVDNEYEVTTVNGIEVRRSLVPFRG